MKILITEKQLNSIITNILSEQKGEEVYNKYYSDIDKNKAIELLKLDNKSKVDNNTIVHIGAGAKILFEIQRNGDIREEDYPKAELYISLINKYNIKYDKSTIKSLPALYKLVKKYMLDADAPLDLILRELPSNEYDKVYEDSKWVIFVPKTEKASCWLGVNTQWCTTYGKYSLNKEFKDRDENKFEEYNRKGPLYIIINKNNENEKYQFHFEKVQFMDKEDEEILLEKFYEDNNGIKSFFKKIGYEKLLNYKSGNLTLSNYYLDIDVLPEHITEVDGYLNLANTSIQSLGNLKEVKEHLNLRDTPIESLGNLEYVGGSLDLSNTQITSLDNLEYVGENLNLYNTPIESLGNLKEVGRNLFLQNTPIKSLGNLKEVGWDLYLQDTQLTSLDNLEKVGGKIYIGHTPLAENYSIKQLEKMYPQFKGKFFI